MKRSVTIALGAMLLTCLALIPMASAATEAEKLGATHAVLVGENEVASGEFAVKNLQTGEQTKVLRDGLVQFLDQHQ